MKRTYPLTHCRAPGLGESRGQARHCPWASVQALASVHDLRLDGLMPAPGPHEHSERSQPMGEVQPLAVR